ncbi:MAG: restriction endonuclease subunit S [Candidatus Paceibacterota bacterium]|jgi:restriction endonuclease S subunit
MTTYSIIKKSEIEGAYRLDPEYYQPEYLKLLQGIKNEQHSTLEEFGCKIVSGPFGSSLKSEAYLETGVPFLRISDLEDFFINDENLTYISEDDNNRLKQSQLKPFDLVLSKVGNTIGIVSSVPEDWHLCNISENNIGIKFTNKEIKAEDKLFLLTFLNSKLGFLQIQRCISGNAQPKINISDIAKLSVVIPKKESVHLVNEFVLSAKLNTNNAKLFYKQAESLLLKELGLENFEKEIEKVLYNVVNFSEIDKFKRMDADYFQAKYEKISAVIRKNNGKCLGELVSLKKGFEPGSEAYQEEGKLFIRVSSLSKDGITDKDQKYLSEKTYEELKKNYQPKKGEILLTKDATPGIAYVLKEDLEGIVAGGVLRLKLKENIESEYLALCINCILGQMQVERDAGGSVIAHWKPEQVKNILIPILPKPIQQKISELVQKSHEARKKAKELLEEAKHKVEELIENN